MIAGYRTLAIGAACALAVLGIRAWRRGAVDVTDQRARAVRIVTVQCDAPAAYDAWMDPGRRALFLRGVTAIDRKPDGEESWSLDRAGRARTLDVEIVDARRPGRIEWRTTKRRPMRAGAAITFAPAPEGRGTEARFSIHVTVRGAKTATAFARLFGAAPAQIAAESLRSFKALMEAGEVPIAVRS